MKLGLIIDSNDPETVWNAFRFGVFALKQGDSVKIFLLGKGVECESIDTPQFKVTDQIKAFTEQGGVIHACGTCLKARQMQGSESCPISNMQTLLDIVKDSDRVLTL
jgi:uncharacterized protein involved in oxidation of intracellular sulfur